MRRKICFNGTIEEFILEKQFSFSDAYTALLQGERMKTLNGMYDELEILLQLPNYFGRNWNALDECLTDFSWLPQGRIIVVISEFEKVLTNFEFDPQYRESELENLLESFQSAVEESEGKLLVYIQEDGDLFQLETD